MSSLLCSQGVVLATAMAVSGTVLLLAFRLQKSLQFPIDQIHPHPSSRRQVLRSCISPPEGKKKGNKKKRVHFAKDVVDPRGDGELFRRQQRYAIVGVAPKNSATSCSSSSSSSSTAKFKRSSGGVGVGAHGGKERGMPANRVALYNGILRDRGVYRLGYSC
ncbi:hypothetical protein Tsubulata_007773 [Turnera subulata]|uniref:Uncharacterized protein n=1 Tax=Turnera subulata TaxID=218843 RepID=A0A9Q0FYX6_9ROSI|nr:hypothetical protein Tsubulata_007773 [Turnera subulata]